MSSGELNNSPRVVIAAKPAGVVVRPDGWTMRTHNRCLAVHYEHRVVVTPGRPLVLTAA